MDNVSNSEQVNNNNNNELSPNNVSTNTLQRNPNGYIGCWKSIYPISHPTYSDKARILPPNFRPFSIGDLQSVSHPHSRVNSCWDFLVDSTSKELHTSIINKNDKGQSSIEGKSHNHQTYTRNCILVSPIKKNCWHNY